LRKGLLFNLKISSCLALIKPSAISFVLSPFKPVKLKSNNLICLKSDSTLPIALQLERLNEKFLKDSSWIRGNNFRQGYRYSLLKLVS